MNRAVLMLVPLLLAATPPQPKRIALTPEDYPEAATNMGAEGDVGIRLAIDARGAITGCTVTAGADLPAGLAADTCTLVKARWRFAPARDDAGKKTDGSAEFTIAWRILKRCPPPAAQTICVFL